MTPLLQALSYAARVGFDAPRCRPCIERPVTRFTFSGDPLPDLMYCFACQGTGLDVSDPERLIGRALVWLESRACDVLHRWPTNEVIVYWDVPVGAFPPGQVARELIERHNSTPESRATAILRLVARVGAPHPQTAPETRETETA